MPMGTTVDGLKPTHAVGESFSRNVWGWTPLKNYVLENHNKYEKAFLDGKLTKLQASRLADALFEDIASGKAEKYADNFMLTVKAEPTVVCEICAGTGIRADELGKEKGMDKMELVALLAEQVGRTHGYCNGCGGFGSRKTNNSSYYLEVEDIQEFAEFLKNSGGANW
jgi:hypothetical protein